jgi:hypothetical protein
LRSLVTLLCVAAAPWFSTIAYAGSARDYLNAPIDSWLTTYNASYSASVTPEDGTDLSSRVRSNVFGQSVVISRTMDFWGRTGGGLSVVLPYVFAEVDSSSFQAHTTGGPFRLLASHARTDFFTPLVWILMTVRFHVSWMPDRSSRIARAA